jgi:hypothetical protein
MATSATETHELSIEGTPTLVVRNAAGSVSVEPGIDGQVRVVVTKKVRSFFGGEGDLENAHVEVTQHGSEITIETHYRGGLGFKGVTVDVDITTPASTNLDLKLNAGNAHLHGITGTLTAVVNAGNLDAAAVALPGSASLELNAGSLTLDGELRPGAMLNVRVNAGNATLTLPQDTPAYLDAKTSVGNIRVSGWRVNTSRNITQQQASGPLGASASGTLTIRVDAGNIQLNSR